MSLAPAGEVAHAHVRRSHAQRQRQAPERLRKPAAVLIRDGGVAAATAAVTAAAAAAAVRCGAVARGSSEEKKGLLVVETVLRVEDTRRRK